MKAGDKVWVQMYGGSRFVPSEVEVVYINGNECVVKFEDVDNFIGLHVCGLKDLYKEKPIPKEVKELADVISNDGIDPVKIAEYLYYGGWIRD